MRVRAAPSTAGGYPTLRAAWRILIAVPCLAQTALADTSVPGPGGDRGKDRKPDDPPPPPDRDRRREPDRPPEPPALGGVPVRVSLPEKPRELSLHLHEPGEPCRRRA
jgi:hypothetical protein